MRLSLAGLLGLVAIAAVGLAALTHSTELWADAAFSMALSVHFAAVVAAIAREGRGRKSAAGFAVCGWGYLVLSLGPWFDSSVGLYLITTPLITLSFHHGVLDPFSFNRVAHSLISIASGMAGGTLAWCLAPRPDVDRPTTSPTGPS